MGARGLKDTERARTRESTKLGSWALTKTEAVITKSAKNFFLGPLHICHGFSLVVWGTPDSGSGVALFCLPLGSFSSAELLYEGLIMILMYLVLCLVLVPERHTIFWGDPEVIYLGEEWRKHWEGWREVMLWSESIVLEKNK